jgi:hypothetical protein
MTKLHKAVSIVAIVASLAIAGTAFAGKSGGGSGSNNSSYAPTLTTSLSGTTSTSSDVQFTISGCGYSAAYGMVTVEVFTPVGVGWVAENADANGCISVTNFSTVGAGAYTIWAWQHVGNKDKVVAQTSFTR